MSDNRTERIEIIDAMRGFALAGIVICHMVEQYIGAAAPISFYEATSSGIVDQVINALIGIFLRGKFIALFSFLFGLSFFIQMDNSAKKGIHFGSRFLWRLLLLLLIGYIHSLFYRGDILTIYAILGIFLIPFYKLDNKWILGFSTLLFLGLGRYVAFYCTGGDHLFFDIDPTNQEAPQVLEYYNTLKNGTIWEVFISNGWEGHLDKMNAQFGIFGRGYFTFAFFLVGLFVGRIDFFKGCFAEDNLTKKVLIWSSILLVVAIGITAGAFASLGPEAKLDNYIAMVGLAGVDLANLAMTLIYIAIFVILYRKTKPKKCLANLAPYGRMALTNYVLQSIIGASILFGWGLGFLGEFTNSNTIIIAIAIILLQVWSSKLWLNYYYYGPLEWIWRSLTYFKAFPMKRK